MSNRQRQIGGVATKNYYWITRRRPHYI